MLCLRENLNHCVNIIVKLLGQSDIVNIEINLLKVELWYIYTNLHWEIAI